jgi:hypothetical protein
MTWKSPLLKHKKTLQNRVNPRFFYHTHAEEKRVITIKGCVWHTTNSFLDISNNCSLPVTFVAVSCAWKIQLNHLPEQIVIL